VLERLVGDGLQRTLAELDGRLEHARLEQRRLFLAYRAAERARAVLEQECISATRMRDERDAARQELDRVQQERDLLRRELDQWHDSLTLRLARPAYAVLDQLRRLRK
jgi:hypothetical protein